MNHKFDITINGQSIAAQPYVPPKDENKEHENKDTPPINKETKDVKSKR